jgi:hypothetical protein
MLFYMLRCTDDGADTFEAAVRDAGGQVMWQVHVEYAFVGDEDPHWTHAAVVRFPDHATLAAASQKSPEARGLLDVQAHVFRGFARTPFPVRIIAALVRAVGVFLEPPLEEIEVWRRRNELDEQTILELMSVTPGGSNPSVAHIQRHLLNERDTPGYMINLIKTRERAAYDELVPKPDTSGEVAYGRRYGLVAVRSVMLLGGYPVVAGSLGPMVVEPDAETSAGGTWDSVAVLRYPRPSSLAKLESMPGYRDAVKHRTAGLERSSMYVSG